MTSRLSFADSLASLEQSNQPDSNLLRRDIRGDSLMLSLALPYQSTHPPFSTEHSAEQSQQPAQCVHALESRATRSRTRYKPLSTLSYRSSSSSTPLNAVLLYSSIVLRKLSFLQIRPRIMTNRQWPADVGQNSPNSSLKQVHTSTHVPRSAPFPMSNFSAQHYAQPRRHLPQYLLP